MDHNKIYIIKSKRQKEKLLCKGFSYNLHRMSDCRKYWRCDLRKCKGSLQTNTVNEFISFKDHTEDHKSYDKNEAAYLKWQMLERSLITSEKSKDIICSVMKIASPLLIKEMPKFNVLGNTITRFRKRTNMHLIHDDIPENIKYTFCNEIFLQNDSGIDDVNRVLIFTTKTHLLHLKMSKTWYCDGTFYSCPSNFSQLYVIMAEVKCITVPLVYISMKNKSKMSYMKVFSYIKEHIDFESPEDITIDFEMAALIALKHPFSNTKINGCFFHFSQPLFRSIQRLGLYSHYVRNINTREVFRMILALAFVPIDKLPEEYLKIDTYISNNGNLTGMLEFWINFKETYGKYILNGEEGKDSIFYFEFWSVHSRIVKNMKKTNNVLEGWNRSLNKNIYQKNPSLYEIGTELKKQHAVVENKLAKLLFIHDPEKFNQKSVCDLSLKFIIENYDSYYGLEFLKAIGSSLKLKEI